MRRGAERQAPGGRGLFHGGGTEAVSLGTLNNCREAVRIGREARSILGGNGIALEYSPLRPAINLKSVRTSEVIDEIHAPGLGSHVTGIRVQLGAGWACAPVSTVRDRPPRA